MGRPKEIKVAVIFHRLGPYHVARLLAAAKVCQVTSIELSATTREYPWAAIEGELGFRRLTVFPDGDSRRAAKTDLVCKLETTLASCDPDVVAVPGWSDRGAISAMRWCLRRRIPIILMSETSAEDERRVWWKEWLKGRLVKLCSAALVGGQSHAAYMANLGMPAEAIARGYDVVDNDYFAAKAEDVRAGKNGVRCDLPANYFLANARFIEKKNLPRLVRAYAQYRDLASRSKRWSLVILGDGELRQELSKLIASLSLQEEVLLPGFKQYDELPVYYGLAKVFVHASTTEQWGLVVNEAMASGLPVLVSNRCGCAGDLVQERRNGFAFEPKNVEKLAQLMMKVATPGFPLSAFGAESRRIIRDFHPDSFGEGLKWAGEIARERKTIRLRLLDRMLLQSLIYK